MNNDTDFTYIPFHYPAIFDRSIVATNKSQGLTCALLCATALEAFIHDVIGWYDFVKKHPMSFNGNFPVDNYLKNTEQKLLEKLIKSEKELMPLTDKFNCFLDWNTSSQPYQDFKTLIQVRNAIAHLKPEELNMTSGNDFIKGYPKFLNNFFQKGIINRPSEFISWIEIIETKKFCSWCQTATHNMIKATIKSLPETNAKKHLIDRFSVNLHSKQTLL